MQQSVEDFCFEAQLGDGKLATMVITTCIQDFESLVVLVDSDFNLFPVDFKLFAFFQFFDVELDDQTNMDRQKEC